MTRDWRADALCRGGVAGLDFYAEDRPSMMKAKAYCAGCPVREECLRDADWEERDLANREVFGVRGGMTANERVVARRRRRRGTVAA